MAATDTKTPNAQLNKWKSTDKPERADFNYDNVQIDTALGNKVDSYVYINSGDVTDLLTRPSGNYAIGPNVTGTPQSTTWNVRTLCSPKISCWIIISSVFGTRNIYQKSYTNGTWYDWNKVITDASAHPTADNAFDLGLSAYRWKNIYAATGTINTSDEREKTDIAALDPENATDFVMALNPVSHKFKDGNRTHYGLVAQQVKESMDEIGLTDMDFAGWIKSPTIDEDGNETCEYTYGLRYTEFIPLLLKVVQEQQKQLGDLSARVAALEAK